MNWMDRGESYGEYFKAEFLVGGKNREEDVSSAL